MLHNHEFLFVTGKYCIYIPTHCFQFAYATQSLVFICHRQILHLYTYHCFIYTPTRCFQFAYATQS